jgi:hypothetical protein
VLSTGFKFFNQIALTVLRNLVSIACSCTARKVLVYSFSVLILNLDRSESLSTEDGITYLATYQLPYLDLHRYCKDSRWGYLNYRLKFDDSIPNIEVMYDPYKSSMNCEAVKKRSSQV